MRILIRQIDNLYRFVTIESSDRDGSLSLIIRREGYNTSHVSWSSNPGEQEPQCFDFDKARAKNKRITIHQSGRVNYHENGWSIFLEPLTLTTRMTCIYAYRIPAIQRLDFFEGSVDPEDAVFDLTDLDDGPISFSFFIGPSNLILTGKAIKLAYEQEGYAVYITVDFPSFSVPKGYEEYFTTLTPEHGPFPEQQMGEDQAMISYHQALTGSTQPILYAPNGEGVIRLIFSVPMRIAPAFKIELTDPDLHVVDQDIKRESRSEKVMLKFKVRNRRTGQIIRQPVSIHSIVLDAEL